MSINQVLQHWQGCVIDVLQDSFWARLKTVEGKEEDMDAQILMTAVSVDDVPLIKDGAVFNWIIGYDEAMNPTSDLAFRRLPAWSAEDQKQADEIEKQLAALFASFGDEAGAVD